MTVSRNLYLLLTLAALAAGVASAQEEAAPASDAAAGETISPDETEAEPVAVPGGIEAITVTGEKLDVTDVQDEAQAITSFSMEDLDKLNIGKVDDLAANVPGLHVGQQGQSAIITLRGIGTENASLTGESGVAFHVDGIYYGRPSAARVAFFDLQNLDVKRGPQGLLGGKNSTSGSINVVTNDPSDEYEVSGDVLWGNYHRFRARGHVNLPLGEYAAFRTAFFQENRDGYLDNELASDSDDPFDADSFGLRSKLRLTPDDSLDMVLTYNYFREKGNGPQADLVPVQRGNNPCSNGVARGPTVMPTRLACTQIPIGRLPFPPYAPIFGIATVEDPYPRRIWTDRDDEQDNTYWGGHGRVNWDAPQIPLLGLTTLELRGGYQRTATRFDWDFDGSNLPFFPLDTSSTVHEYTTDVRWGGLTFDERLEWQTSLFFVREIGDSETVTPGTATSDSSGGSTGISTAKLTTYQEIDNKSYGAALHGELRLSDSWTFGLGGRWIKDRKSTFLSRVEGDELEHCSGALPSVTDPRTGEQVFLRPPDCSLTDRGTAWGARLEWRPIEDMLWYARIDRGHKAGGFGLGGTGFYLPEKIWAYSIGTKSEFFDRRLQINLEGFFYAYEDMQIALIDGTATRTENTDTRMYGWELEAEANPLYGLQLRAVVSYLNTRTIDYYSLDPATLGNRTQDSRLRNRLEAELDHTPFVSKRCNTGTDTNVFCGSLGDRNGLDDFSGNQLSRAPEWKFTASAEYEIPLGSLGWLTPRVQYTWNDESYQRPFNKRIDYQEEYHETDVKLIWNSPERRWNVEVFVDNIEDVAVKQYILIGSRLFSSPALAWYNEPRFSGIKVGFRY